MFRLFVFPCAKLRIPSGNVLKNDLEKIWNESEMFNLPRDRSNFKACGDCDFLNNCGGCRSAALESSGELFGKDPLCFKDLIQ
ncbi:MAG: SPASM domain-containing protein [Candidatus Micrarchaeia archaeon]